MKTLSLAASLLLGSLAAALPAISAEPPQAKAELIAGTGLVHSKYASPFGYRAETTLPALAPFNTPSLAKRSEPFVRSKRDNRDEPFEIVFFARTRPVRIRIAARHDGLSPLDKWEETLKLLHKAFDRDGDGRLDKREAELIYTKNEVKTMFQGGVGYRAQSGGTMPTLEALDRDTDGSVSFEEFAYYYDELTGELARAKEAPNYAQTQDLLTPEIFARLDANDDQRLSEEELKAAEKLLIALDGDEDECVSALEITSNPVKNKIPVLNTGGAGMGMMERPGTKLASTSTGIQSFHGPLPGSVVQNLVKRYDNDGDFELSRIEIGFPKELFDKLDADTDGQLDAKELDAWRTGSPDLSVEVNTAVKAAKCTAKLVIEPKGDVTAKQTTPDRVIVSVQGQTLDIGASANIAQQPNQLADLFPAGKDVLLEKDLVGPQFQLLRVLFEPADFDGDGKLTRAEFNKYFELQQMVTRNALGLIHQTRVPNLFALLDSNNDGKLSVKELRSAYERLIPLEPTGGRLVTRALLQPSAIIRLGHWIYGSYDPNLLQQQSPNMGYGAQPAVPTVGPIWFRKMDRNADGDVSKTEFVGPKDSFDAIDGNKDGLITLAEAEAFDKTLRR